MVVALYLIALAMIGAGAACVAYGSDIVLNERGWAMVISGSVVASAGLVLARARGDRGAGEAPAAGVRGSARRRSAGRARASRPARLRRRPPRPPLPALRPPPPRPAGRDEPEERAVLEGRGRDPGARPGGARLRTLAAPGARRGERRGERRGIVAATVIGTYSSGGQRATSCIADGSIEADTPTGRYTFQSLDELKEFIAAGGEAARGRSG